MKNPNEFPLSMFLHRSRIDLEEMCEDLDKHIKTKPSNKTQLVFLRAKLREAIFWMTQADDSLEVKDVSYWREKIKYAQEKIDEISN